MAACVPIQPVAAVPEAIWAVSPGGESDTAEYMYSGPDYSGEDCIHITVEAEALPSQLEVYVQSAADRWAIDLIPWLQQGVKEVEVPLVQLQLKDPIYGALDGSQTYQGQEIDYMGLHAFDPTRKFNFAVTSLAFDSCAD